MRVAACQPFKPGVHGNAGNDWALVGFYRSPGAKVAAAWVPIVEPEILMDGEHSIDRCYEATEATLREVFYQLGHQGVVLEDSLLKPNMVLSGKSAQGRASAEEIAEKTVACFKRTVPAAVPGVVFLSGGQNDEEATVNLNAINQHAAAVGYPWELSFSYGRGLQASPLSVWAGLPDNKKLAQQAFRNRALLTSAARRGDYTPGMDRET